MELIEGRPLDELIPSSGMPVDQALAFAIEHCARSRSGPSRRHRASRPQAVQRHGDRRGHGQTSRFWACQAVGNARPPAREPIPSPWPRVSREDRSDCRHHRLHVAGAGPGQASRRAQRSIQLRHDAVRNVDGQASLPRRQPRRDADGYSAMRSRAPSAPSRRRLTNSTVWWPAACASRRSAGSRQRPICGWRSKKSSKNRPAAGRGRRAASQHVPGLDGRRPRLPWWRWLHPCIGRRGPSVFRSPRSPADYLRVRHGSHARAVSRWQTAGLCLRPLRRRIARPLDPTRRPVEIPTASPRRWESYPIPSSRPMEPGCCSSAAPPSSKSPPWADRPAGYSKMPGPLPSRRSVRLPSSTPRNGAATDPFRSRPRPAVRRASGSRCGSGAPRAWSPDGRRLAFIGLCGNDYGIFVVAPRRGCGRSKYRASRSDQAASNSSRHTRTVVPGRTLKEA